jgi:hypothetical protein
MLFSMVLVRIPIATPPIRTDSLCCFSRSFRAVPAFWRSWIAHSGTVTRLRAWFPKKSWFDSRKGQEIYVLLNASIPILGCTQSPRSLGRRSSFPSGRATGVWSLTLSPSNTEAKNQWISTFTTSYVFCWPLFWKLIRQKFSMLIY